MIYLSINYCNTFWYQIEQGYRYFVFYKIILAFLVNFQFYMDFGSSKPNSVIYTWVLHGTVWNLHVNSRRTDIPIILFSHLVTVLPSLVITIPLYPSVTSWSRCTFLGIWLFLLLLGTVLFSFTCHRFLQVYKNATDIPMLILNPANSPYPSISSKMFHWVSCIFYT